MDTTRWIPLDKFTPQNRILWVYTAPAEDLPGFQGVCRWHPDAGFCTDELREVTHWTENLGPFQDPVDAGTLKRKVEAVIMLMQKSNLRGDFLTDAVLRILRGPEHRSIDGV